MKRPKAKARLYHSTQGVVRLRMDCETEVLQVATHGQRYQNSCLQPYAPQGVALAVDGRALSVIVPPGTFAQQNTPRVDPLKLARPLKLHTGQVLTILPARSCATFDALIVMKEHA